MENFCKKMENFVKNYKKLKKKWKNFVCLLQMYILSISIKDEEKNQ